MNHHHHHYQQSSPAQQQQQSASTTTTAATSDESQESETTLPAFKLSNSMIPIPPTSSPVQQVSVQQLSRENVQLQEQVRQLWAINEHLRQQNSVLTSELIQVVKRMESSNYTLDNTSSSANNSAPSSGISSSHIVIQTPPTASTSSVSQQNELQQPQQQQHVEIPPHSPLLKQEVVQQQQQPQQSQQQQQPKEKNFKEYNFVSSQQQPQQQQPQQQQQQHATKDIPSEQQPQMPLKQYNFVQEERRMAQSQSAADNARQWSFTNYQGPKSSAHRQASMLTPPSDGRNAKRRKTESEFKIEEYQVNSNAIPKQPSPQSQQQMISTPQSSPPTTTHKIDMSNFANIKKKPSGTYSFRNAIYIVLLDAKVPLTVNEICDRAMYNNLVATNSKTPQLSFSACISKESQNISGLFRATKDGRAVELNVPSPDEQQQPHQNYMFAQSQQHFTLNNSAGQHND